MVRLIGGPADTYARLKDAEAIVVGVYRDGAMSVDSCVPFEAEFSRRG